CQRQGDDYVGSAQTVRLMVLTPVLFPLLRLLFDPLAPGLGLLPEVFAPLRRAPGRLLGEVAGFSCELVSSVSEPTRRSALCACRARCARRSSTRSAAQPHDEPDDECG